MKGNGNGSAGSVQSHAPLLASGGVGYATWKTRMDVYLQRAGAEAIHTTPMDIADWNVMVESVRVMKAESLASAMELIKSKVQTTDPSSGSKDDAAAAAAKKTTVIAQMDAARKVISGTVERSRKIYGVIYESLPSELRSQVDDTVPNGFAYGLWHWLENKFQSTEEDSVGDLLAQWTTLRQEDAESFDAYRARVNKLYELLKCAKEEPSARMYAFILVDRLQPRYKQIVLALRAGGKLKAPTIVWDEVTAQINSHERSEARIGSETGADGSVSSAQAMSATKSTVQQQSSKENDRQQSAPWQSKNRSSSPSSRDSHRKKIQCFRCDGYGHIGRYCTVAKKTILERENDNRPSSNKYNRRSEGEREQASAAIGRRGENRFTHLSSDEDGVDQECETLYAVREQQTSPNATRPPSAFADAVKRGLQLQFKPKLVMGRSARVDPNNPPPLVSILKPTVVAEKLRVSPVMVASQVSARPRTRPSSAVAAAASSDAARPSSPPPRQRESPAAAARDRKPLGVGSNPDKALANYAWGIDSMASLHVSGNKDLFAGLKKCAPISVQMADGGTVTTMHYGTVRLKVSVAGGRTVGIPIENVYYHERFAANLLSWNVLRVKEWEFHSTKDESYLMTPGGNRVKLSTKGRVSVLDSAAPERVFTVGEMLGANVDALVKLHQRLGHIPFERVIRLIKGGEVLDVTKIHATDHELLEAKQQIRECPACIQAKGMRTPFTHRGVDHGTGGKGQVLHMDTYHIQLEHDGRKWVEYGLTVTDAYTQYRWFKRIISKDQVADAVIEIIKMARTQFGCKVKRLRSDGGTEFINRTLKDYCADHGIALTYPPARTQQLNGVAENAVRQIKDATRTLLLHANTPRRFWHYAANHATYVWNRTHVARLTKITPFESMFGNKPSVRHWGVFGQDAYYHIPKEQRTALGQKMDPCIYLGHSAIQNCALVYVLRTKKIIATRDVTYRVNKFKYGIALARGEQTVIDNAIAAGGQDFACDDESSDEDETLSEQPSSAVSVAAAPIATEERYEIERIVDRRVNKGRTEFKVRWTGYNESDDTWETENKLKEDAPNAINEFLSSRPPIRQSPRLHNDTVDDHDAEPQLHMVMSAMSAMVNSEQHAELSSTDIVCAVESGVAKLEADVPQTHKQMLASPMVNEWLAADAKELASCLAHEVWILVPRIDLPRGANVLPVKTVRKIKTDENGLNPRCKVRFTPKGYKQIEGKDYFEVFAGTGSYKAMRFGLSLAAKWDHELVQLDVETAFLNADVTEEIYMELPEGEYRDQNHGMVARLQKSLYGLKQAPRNWYLLVRSFIVDELGYTATVSDPCLFYRRSRTGQLMLMFLFVDDFQASYHKSDTDEWNEIKSTLMQRFKCKDMGESKWILGMRITRDRDAGTMTLDQELYVTKALEKYGLAECRTAPTPEVVGAAHQDPSEEQDRPTDRQRYMEIVGTLMYAAISTRPDIAHGVHYLASHMLNPTHLHMVAAERVMRYLAGTKDVGLIFGSRNDGESSSKGYSQLQIDVCAFADADWANGKGDRRSITGWVAKLNNDPISWASKKQRTVALSTCEAELYAEAAAIQEVLWLRGLLQELGLHNHAGSVIYGDNQSAIAVSKNGVKGERTKHVDVKYHFVTETVERGDVALKWVPSADQEADIFTKALPAPSFIQLRKKLMSQ